MRTSRRCSRGPTRCARSACEPTPTRRRTRDARGSSVPRASACAGPSTCSWPRTAMPKMRAMIMAHTARLAARRWRSCSRSSRQDFEGLFEVMAGLPVTIRLLDPPLHEFLPNLEELATQVERARIEGTAGPRRAREDLLARVARDPARRTRCSAPAGCRLGILYPEIYEMQVHAIIRAAHERGQAAGSRDHDPARRLRAELSSCASW